MYLVNFTILNSYIDNIKIEILNINNLDDEIIFRDNFEIYYV